MHTDTNKNRKRTRWGAGLRAGLHRSARVAVLPAIFSLWITLSALAQAPLPTPQPPPLPYPAAPPYTVPPTPPVYPPMELDRMVSPIALYPDPLLTQVLAAATFPSEIPDAARWADEHHYLTGAALTAAIAADQLPWDPSVQALLPFPSILDLMASAMPWTQELGNAFLAQRADVMDAVQRMRRMAVSYGYLRTNPQVIVRGGPYIEILPANPAFIVVPYYDPRVVFVAPRPGFAVATAISFGFGVSIGAMWGPWGWGTSRFEWPTHTLIIANAPWGRTFANRGVYVHPYTIPRYERRAPEQHRPIPRSEGERRSHWTGRDTREEHRR